MNIRMIYLSLNKLKLIAKNRGIKDYESKSADLTKIHSEPKIKISLSKKKIREIKKKKKKLMNQDINFAKPKIKES